MPKKFTKASTQRISHKDVFKQIFSPKSAVPNLNEKRLVEGVEHKELNTCQKLARSLNLMEPSHWIFLVLVGIITAIVWYCIHNK